MREKLIELLKYSPHLSVLKYFDGYCTFEEAADWLIANGVTVKVKTEKPPADLTRKCGSCVYASTLASYIRCTNPTKRWLREIAAYKARTTPCCKAYKECCDRESEE